MSFGTKEVLLIDKDLMLVKSKTFKAIFLKTSKSPLTGFVSLPLICTMIYKNDDVLNKKTNKKNQRKSMSMAKF